MVDDSRPLSVSKESELAHLQDIIEKSEQTTSLDETPENVKGVIEETSLQSEWQMSPSSYKDQKETIQPLLTQPLKKGDSW